MLGRQIMTKEFNNGEFLARLYIQSKKNFTDKLYGGFLGDVYNSMYMTFNSEQHEMYWELEGKRDAR